MSNFEAIYKNLEKFLIEELPNCIDKINQRHNDGVFVIPFNKSEMKIKPYFEINFEKSAYTEKDILVENEIYNLGITFYLNEQDKDFKIKLWRYFEAIEELLAEESNVKITGTNDVSIKVKVTL